MKRIHQLLNELGLMDEKLSYVSQYSSGRETSIKGLFLSEADQFIRDLERRSMTPAKREELEKVQRMRNKITAMLKHELGLTYSQIDEWCISRGHAKKKLFDYTLAELPQLVSQAEAYHKYYLSKK